MASSEDETLHTLIATAILNRLNERYNHDHHSEYKRDDSVSDNDEEMKKTLKQLLYASVFNKLVEPHAPLEGTDVDPVSRIPGASPSHNHMSIRTQSTLITIVNRLRGLISAVPSAAAAAAASASGLNYYMPNLNYMHTAYSTLRFSPIFSFPSLRPSGSPRQPQGSPTQPLQSSSSQPTRTPDNPTQPLPVSSYISDTIPIIQNAIKTTNRERKENEVIIRGLEWCLKELEAVLQLQKDQEKSINELTSKLIKHVQIIVYEIKATIVKTELMDSCEKENGSDVIISLYDKINNANVSREEKEKILLCATIEEMTRLDEDNISSKYSFWNNLDNVYSSLGKIQYLDDPSITYIYMIFKDWEIFTSNHTQIPPDEMPKLFKLFFIHNSFF